jgi:hypothetical protein
MYVFMYECANDIHVYMKGGMIGRILSPVMNVFLQIHAQCVSYSALKELSTALLLSFVLFKYILM